MRLSWPLLLGALPEAFFDAIGQVVIFLKAVFDFHEPEVVLEVVTRELVLFAEVVKRIESQYNHSFSVLF